MFYKTLHEAIRKEDVEDVEDHIRNGADINGQDANKYTPLIIAVGTGNKEIVELLIKSKADLNETGSNHEYKPLVQAVFTGNLDIVKLLVDAGAEIENHALNFAVRTKNLALVKFFISQISTDKIDLLTNALIYACRIGNMDIARILIDAGARVITEDENSTTNLHVAVERNNASMLEYLLSCDNVFVDAKFRGETALQLASKTNVGESHFDVIEKLLENGADVNLQDCLGKTPLHSLIAKASFKTVELLLKFKADVNKFDAKGDVPLFDAVKSGEFEIIRLLVDRGGSDIKYVNPTNGLTALHLLDEYLENVNIIKCLLKKGAKIDALDSDGSTTLLRKLRLNGYKSINHNILKFLLKYSNVNIINSSGENILTYIETDGYVWKIVLGHLAKLQAQNFPLHPNILTKISTDPEFNRYFNKCTQELLRAKNTKPRNSWITYFDLLVANERMLKNYAANPDLQASDFEKDEFKKKFRIYGACIWKNVIKGMKRRELFDESTVLLYNSLPIFNLTHLVIRDILDCTSTKDLTRFVAIALDKNMANDVEKN